MRKVSAAPEHLLFDWGASQGTSPHCLEGVSLARGGCPEKGATPAASYPCISVNAGQRMGAVYGGSPWH